MCVLDSHAGVFCGWRTNALFSLVFYPQLAVVAIFTIESLYPVSRSFIPTCLDPLLTQTITYGVPNSAAVTVPPHGRSKAQNCSLGHAHAPCKPHVAIHVIEVAGLLFGAFLPT